MEVQLLLIRLGPIGSTCQDKAHSYDEDRQARRQGLLSAAADLGAKRDYVDSRTSNIYLHRTQDM